MKLRVDIVALQLEEVASVLFCHGKWNVTNGG